MSVYSGFASRSQEASYNRSLYNMLCLLQLKVTKSLKGGTSFPVYPLVESFDGASFTKYFTKFYQRLFLMDETKYLAPKFSYALKDLATYCGIFEKVTHAPRSTSSSTSSFQQFQLNMNNTDPLLQLGSEEKPRSSHRSPEPRGRGLDQPSRGKAPVRGGSQRTPLGAVSSHSSSSANKSRIGKKRDPATSPATIHNNNIIITINKSFNLTGADRPQVRNNKHLSEMKNVYSGSKPRRRPFNGARTTPLGTKPGNDRGRLGLKYGTQRVKPTSAAEVSPPYDSFGTSKHRGAEEEELLRKLEGQSIDANYSDLEVIREDPRNQRTRGKPAPGRNGAHSSGAYFAYKRLVPATRGGGQW